MLKSMLLVLCVTLSLFAQTEDSLFLENLGFVSIFERPPEVLKEFRIPLEAILVRMSNGVRIDKPEGELIGRITANDIEFGGEIHPINKIYTATDTNKNELVPKIIMCTQRYLFMLESYYNKNIARYILVVVPKSEGEIVVLVIK